MRLVLLLLAFAAALPAPEPAAPPEFVQAVEFPYYLYPRTLWERELVWLKTVGIRTVEFSIPWNWHQVDGGACDFTGATSPRRDLLGFIRLLRRLEMRAWIRPLPPVKGWVNNGYPHGYQQGVAQDRKAVRPWLHELENLLAPQTEKHGGPIAFVEGGTSINAGILDAPPPPLPVTVVSAHDPAAMNRSRQALAAAGGALLWEDVEDALFPAGWERPGGPLYRAGAVSLSGDERPTVSALRRNAALLRHWAALLPGMKPERAHRPAAALGGAAARHETGTRAPGEALDGQAPARSDRHGTGFARAWRGFRGLDRQRKPPAVPEHAARMGSFHQALHRDRKRRSRPAPDIVAARECLVGRRGALPRMHRIFKRRTYCLRDGGTADHRSAGTLRLFRGGQAPDHWPRKYRLHFILFRTTCRSFAPAPAGRLCRHANEEVSIGNRLRARCTCRCSARRLGQSGHRGGWRAARPRASATIPARIGAFGRSHPPAFRRRRGSGRGARHHPHRRHGRPHGGRQHPQQLSGNRNLRHRACGRWLSILAAQNGAEFRRHHGSRVGVSRLPRWRSSRPARLGCAVLRRNEAGASRPIPGDPARPVSGVVRGPRWRRLSGVGPGKPESARRVCGQGWRQMAGVRLERFRPQRSECAAGERRLRRHGSGRSAHRRWRARIHRQRLETDRAAGWRRSQDLRGADYAAARRDSRNRQAQRNYLSGRARVRRPRRVYAGQVGQASGLSRRVTAV